MQTGGWFRVCAGPPGLVRVARHFSGASDHSKSKSWKVENWPTQAKGGLEWATLQLKGLQVLDQVMLFLFC